MTHTATPFLRGGINSPAEYLQLYRHSSKRPVVMATELYPISVHLAGVLHKEKSKVKPMEDFYINIFILQMKFA